MAEASGSRVDWVLMLGILLPCMAPLTISSHALGEQFAAVALDAVRRLVLKRR